MKQNIKAQRHCPLCGEFTGDRWIPRTNGQWRGKCFHLMSSSWYNKDARIYIDQTSIWRESVGSMSDWCRSEGICCLGTNRRITKKLSINALRMVDWIRQQNAESNLRFWNYPCSVILTIMSVYILAPIPAFYLNPDWIASDDHILK